MADWGGIVRLGGRGVIRCPALQKTPGEKGPFSIPPVVYPSTKFCLRSNMIRLIRFRTIINMMRMRMSMRMRMRMMMMKIMKMKMRKKMNLNMNKDKDDKR